jgi:hypothetical protein
MTHRKIFYLDEDINQEKPITAGGVIIYKIEKGQIYLLLIDSRGNFEDFGGRSDENDETIFDMVSREAYEESNMLLDRNKIKERLITAKYVYSINSKYIVYIINALEDESKLTSEMFGNKEIYDNIPRKVKWISLNVFLKPEIIKFKVCARLKNKLLFDILKKIEKDMLEWEIFD